ncbi:MAG: type II toxin-antitoxin system HicB family antitoxin [Candidatus Eremiobacteraeota bacterium]|nr:type II toxin-antitoxin system HicB family antitoxin [Candidatus Eremiobacteraeota bacterium]
MNYVVIFEKTPTGYSAYAPDLPGYAATAKTTDALRKLVREGIPLHVEGLRRVRKPIPRPRTIVDVVEVA